MYRIRYIFKFLTVRVIRTHHTYSTYFPELFSYILDRYAVFYQNICNSQGIMFRPLRLQYPVLSSKFPNSFSCFFFLLLFTNFKCTTNFLCRFSVDFSHCNKITTHYAKCIACADQQQVKLT